MLNRLAMPDVLKAAAIGALVTLMAMPRIAEGRMDPWTAMPVAFPAMTLISLAAFSWGCRAGLHGVFPECRRMFIGLGVAAMMGLVLAWVGGVYLDPIFKGALERAGRADLLELRYPPTTTGWIALVLWTAGFETMFFQVGAISFFSRLTDHQWLVVVGAVSFRSMVTSLQVYQAGVVDAVWLFVLASMAASALGCMLYARAGLPAAMLFSAVLSMRVSGLLMAPVR